MPLISVIVPCYNQAQYLDECLQSVLDQTFQDWECIIVNDGSPDHTVDVAQRWVEKDVRFKYLYKENGGLSSARNAGIEKAEGEWILPLDADDRIGNKYLELAEKEFCKNPTIVYCKANFFGTISKHWNLEDYSYLEFMMSNTIFCSAFFKKSSWQAGGGYDENLIYGREDWDLWLGILDEDSSVICIDYIGFFYRRKDDSMDVAINADKSKLNFTDFYIVKKHLDKYLLLDKNPIKNYIDTFYKLKELTNLKNRLEHNRFTKLLFGLILRIS